MLNRELEKTRGKVSNIRQVHSQWPASMRAHLTLYMDLMFAANYRKAA